MVWVQLVFLIHLNASAILVESFFFVFSLYWGELDNSFRYKNNKLRFREHEQWAQCDGCSKWRRLPVDVLLPSKWMCTDNVWDQNRLVMGFVLQYFLQ